MTKIIFNCNFKNHFFPLIALNYNSSIKNNNSVKTNFIFNETDAILFHQIRNTNFKSL
jgi:hypothetical protein